VLVSDLRSKFQFSISLFFSQLKKNTIRQLFYYGEEKEHLFNTTHIIYAKKDNNNEDDITMREGEGYFVCFKNTWCVTIRDFYTSSEIIKFSPIISI
jgi:hypothetical protein